MGEGGVNYIHRLGSLGNIHFWQVLDFGWGIGGSLLSPICICKKRYGPSSHLLLSPKFMKSIFSFLDQVVRRGRSGTLGSTGLPGHQYHSKQPWRGKNILAKNRGHPRLVQLTQSKYIWVQEACKSVRQKRNAGLCRWVQMCAKICRRASKIKYAQKTQQECATYQYRLQNCADGCNLLRYRVGGCRIVQEGIQALEVCSK